MKCKMFCKHQTCGVLCKGPPIYNSLWTTCRNHISKTKLAPIWLFKALEKLEIIVVCASMKSTTSSAYLIALMTVSSDCLQVVRFKYFLKITMKLSDSFQVSLPSDLYTVCCWEDRSTCDINDQSFFLKYRAVWCSFASLDGTFFFLTLYQDYSCGTRIFQITAQVCSG